MRATAPAECHGDHLPTALQEMLLRAALGCETNARAAWEQWSRRVDFERMDPTSVRLLPLLYWNLNRLGVNDHPLYRRIAAVVKLGWARAEMTKRALNEPLRALTSAVDQVLVLGDLVLSEHYYPSAHTRTLERAEVCVPEGRVQPALDALRQIGWLPEPPVTPALLAAAYEIELRNPEHPLALSLAWHPLGEGKDTEIVKRFFEQAATMDVAQVPVQVCASADELVRVCVQGACWNWYSTCRWVADAVIILRREAAGLDWRRVVEWGGYVPLRLPLHRALSYLATEWDAPVAAGVLERFQAMPVPNSCWKAYRVQTTNYYRRPHLYLRRLWVDYVQHAHSTGREATWAGCARYWRDRWGLRTIWMLPLYIAMRGWSAFRMMRQTRPLHRTFRAQIKLEPNEL